MLQNGRGGGTYLNSVGAAGVLRAGGTVINGISRVTTGLVAGQLEERPVILIEVQFLFLATHEEVLTLGHEADQGLGVEPHQLGVGTLLAANAAQEAVELELGAAGGGLAGHTQLGGGGRGDPSVLEAGAPAAASAAWQSWCWNPVAIAFEGFLQRLRRGEDMMVAVPGARGKAEVGLLTSADVGFRVAEVQLGTCRSRLGAALGPEEAIWRRGRPAH